MKQKRKIPYLLFTLFFAAAGREAAVLYDANVNPGVVEVVWDASAFPGGVYFNKLTAEGFTDTKKMVLIK